MDKWKGPPSSSRVGEERELRRFVLGVLEHHEKFEGPAGADTAQSRSYMVERLGFRTDTIFRPVHDLLCALSTPAGDPLPLRLITADVDLLEGVVLNELVLLRAVRGWMDAQNGMLARLDPQVRPPIHHLVIAPLSLALF